MTMGERIDVTDASDPRLDHYRNLTDVALRRQQEPRWGLFMAESAKVIARAVAAGHEVESALTSPKWLPDLAELLSATDAPIYVADESVLKSVTGYRVHRGALAAMRRSPLPTLVDVMRGANRIAVFEGIVDHTNVGSAFRSIAGLGFDAVVIDPTCADPLYRRSVRVSMGAVFSVPWTRVDEWPAALDDLRAAGFSLVGLSPGGSQDLGDFAAAAPPRVAVLLGAEGAGLTPQAMERVDRLLRIPMAEGVDSLNMAAATAVACYALGIPKNVKM